MGLKNLVHVFVVILSCLVYSSTSYQFVAGGRDGWVLKPSESYLHWASRMRFQVNDTILFKYKSGSDSVLVVNKEDYDGCDVGSPLLKLDDGNSVFKFNRSGPFYFISGNKPNCDQGQKLITVVMAPRTPPSPPIVLPPQGSSPTPSPSAGGGGGGGGAPAPATSPSSTSPAPATSPSSTSPAPATSPSSTSPAPATSPSSTSPAPATSPSSSASPGPATSPSSTSPSPAGSGPSPAGGSSEPPSSSSTPGSPGSSTAGGPGGSSTPGSGTPADANSPPAPPRSAASPPCSASILVASLVLSVGFGVVTVSH